MRGFNSEHATGTLEGIGERDHSATSEYRIFGPPGTGKTTNLTRQVRRAVERYGADSVLVTSFSRAAAAELAGRDLPVPPERIGTLHSHCYHALGAPEIAEGKVSEWNRENPGLHITPTKKYGKLEGEESAAPEDEGAEGEHEGDALLRQVNRFRGLMLKPALWPPVVAQFAQKWNAYKEGNGLLDFTDLIERCARDVPAAPRNPSVIFADEAQDLNAMQLALIRKWGARAEFFVVAGDDDQTIYSFTGASPEAILDPDIPEDHKIILKQSYRVPVAVHQFADALIHTVKRRQAKVYLPRPSEGAFERIDTGGYKSAEYGILKTAIEHLERGQSVMFLASCSYMVRPITQVLRKEGIPFHNPYRRSNGFWNPLRHGQRGSTANRISALLVAHPDWGEGHRQWNHGDLALWAEWLSAKGILKHGAKKKLASFDVNTPVSIERLDEIFEPAALDSLLAAYEGDHRALLEWWHGRVLAEVHERARFPVEVVRKRGPGGLFEEPRVIVGTIHSVKGGEADVVFLFPDLSQAGGASYQMDGAPRDSVVRLFYVGATRARECLYLCRPETAQAACL